MSQISPPRPKMCNYCGKILHGRSDQVYCNDTCRNTFNRQKRAAEKITEHENLPEIFRIIKRNYQILKQRSNTPLEENESIMSNTPKLIAEGFNPKFFTSVTTDKYGMKWNCVFEMGFSMGDEHTLIKDFPEQAAVDAKN